MTGRAAAYVSPACHIGTHAKCDKGAAGSVVVPGVRREACACRCHAVGPAGPHRPARPHQPAGSFVGAANTVPSGAAA